MQTRKENKNKTSIISQQTHITETVGENGKIQYNCTACQKTFQSRSQRYYHINCNQLQNLSYKCEHCEKRFARRTQWKYHIVSHISPINECDKCQKTFSNPLALKKHVALHKTQLKLCPHCDKTFKKKSSLDQHIAAQHLNLLQYECANCSKKYASKSALQLHLQTHKKKRFECTICRKLFQRNSILNLHLKRHNKMNNYTCAVCDKVFSESGALARHNKIHEENVKQYFCKLCDKIILRKDNMSRHLNTIHPEENFDNIVKVIKPAILHTQLQVGSGECYIYNSGEDNGAKADKKVVIIENKLLHTPLEEEDLSKGFKLSKTFSNEIEAVKNPLINQIKVITAVPSYETEIHSHNVEKTSQEIKKQFEEKNVHHQEDSILIKNHEAYCKYSLRVAANGIIKPDNNVDQSNKNIGNIALVDHIQSNFRKFPHLSREGVLTQELGASLDNINMSSNNNQSSQQQSTRKRESVKTQTFPSVIRSVGNVKKNLTSQITSSPKRTNETTIEYKHKKYCRNNYNIDLYRKILGCDDDEDQDVHKQQRSDHMPKSSNPIHWRKCFKNIYETSAL